MSRVTRPPKRAAGQELASPDASTTDGAAALDELASAVEDEDAGTETESESASESESDPATRPLALPQAPSGPTLAVDPGLYAVLGLDPSASDALIMSSYRRQAERLLRKGATNTHAMRELNAAYEVLGNPLRRAEYDRLRFQQTFAPADRTPLQPGVKVARRATRRTRPRHIVQQRYAGLPEVMVVLMVVGLAVLAGALLIPRLSFNLSALGVLQNVLPLSATRRTAEPPPASTAVIVVPTPTLRPGVAERFSATSVAVSDPAPAQNSLEQVTVRLRRDGQPVSNVEVWAVVEYRTARERWPASGTQKTDSAGNATIAFNIGSATPNYPVTVRVFAQADDQQPSWSTTFTPR
jgi:hypothetical protein